MGNNNRSSSDLKPIADAVFEVCYEVCNKVGGIYTVVSSKALQMTKIYKEYFLIGPYYKDKAEMEFQEIETPANLKDIFKELKQEGIICHFGKWLIKGEPNTILIEFDGFKHALDGLKVNYWEHFQVDSMNAHWDFFEPMLWSTAAGKVIEKFQEKNENKKVVGHFHEWISGFGLLLLKMAKSKAKTIFTTHATMLGRSIAGNGENLYMKLDFVNPDEDAKRLNVNDKYTAEKACANNADIFTTVSEITQIEAEKILGRKADVLTLNGLDMSIFPSFEQTSNMHVKSREKLKEFTSYFFFPYYTFDLKETLFYFISGRYEYRNKGIDFYIKALKKLNDYLIENKVNKTVVAMFMIPSGIRGIKQDLLESKTYYKHISTYMEDNIEEIKHNMIDTFVKGDSPTCESILSRDFLTEIRRSMKSFKKEGTPPIVTHQLENYDEDPIVQNLLAEGLDNKKENRVKAVQYPVYIDNVDGLIDLPYYEMTAGCHLGVFPSYYEPWGYTPAEANAMGVPCITSDLAGYGRYIKPLSKKEDGTVVISRYKREEQDGIKELFEELKEFTLLDHQERVDRKIAAKQSIEKCDWKDFIKFYVEAHNKSFGK